MLAHPTTRGQILTSNPADQKKLMAAPIPREGSGNLRRFG